LPGDAVRVFDSKRRFLGVAHYSSTSQICLRMLTARDEPIDRAFFRRRIKDCIDYRQRIVSDSDAYRVVFGEADLLPGLTIDRYADCVVLQTLDQGMDAAKDDIAACIGELLHPRAVVLRNDVSVRLHESLSLEKKVLEGDASTTVRIRMNGLAFEADLLGGQKTGVYLDQRENYVAAARYAHGRVLDCFTSSGGFAMHAASRCEHVRAVDSSAAALGLARRNASANGIANIDFSEADVFDLLASEAHGRQSYSTVILDPPAFAKSRTAVEAAARGYKEINLRALRLLGAGGTLVTCSCSHHMSEARLLEVVAAAALDAGRTLRVIERRTQAADHPILLTVPETLYLKCLILEVLP
jgi:23S rRNA (cytosine1962-C5)-methyltransferase